MAALLPREDKMDLDVTVRTIITGVPRQDEAPKAVDADYTALPPSETGVQIAQKARRRGPTVLGHTGPIRGLPVDEPKLEAIRYPDAWDSPA